MSRSSEPAGRAASADSAPVAWAVPGTAVPGATVPGTAASAGQAARSGQAAPPGQQAPADQEARAGQRVQAGQEARAGQRAQAGQEARAGQRAQAGQEARAGQEAAARQICLRMLTAAPRTRAQLAAALRQRGIPDETAAAVLGRFSEVKLIDDAAFAAAWVESRHHGRGLSGRALAAELRHRGVPPEDIKAAVGGLDPRQEIATARGLVERRLASTRGQPLNARIRRLTGLLARKGYSPAIAYRVVREALDQEGLDPAAAGIDLDDPPEAENDEQMTAW